MYKIKTDKGNIIIGKLVIARIVKDAMQKHNPYVYLVNKKCSSSVEFGMEYKENVVNFIDVAVKNENLDVNLYVVLKFGKSIKEVTKELFFDIREALKKSIETEPREITIQIVGVKSKEISKREIIVKG